MITMVAKNKKNVIVIMEKKKDVKKENDVTLKIKQNKDHNKELRKKMEPMKPKEQ